MKTIIIVGHDNQMTANFRGNLIREIISKGFKVIVIGPNQSNTDILFEFGINAFYEIPMNRTGTSFLSDLKYTYRLYKIFKYLKPDYTLNITIKPVIYGAIAAKISGIKNINSLLTGIGYVFTSNSLKAQFIKKIIYLPYKIGLNCAKNVIFQNVDDLNEFKRLRLITKKKCHIVNGSGVDMNLFKFHPYPTQLSFFITSRILYSKGVLEFLQAARIVKKKYPNIRFALIGSNEKQADSIPNDVFFDYVNDGSIEYLGTTDNVFNLLKESSVYILPSYREGVPRSVLEAMSMSRPIITTNVPGCREAVIDGYNGFLVPKQDVLELVNKIEWFILNKHMIPIMGKNSFDLCEKKFEISKVNSQMLSIMNI